jgi:hypothetical protein
MSKWSAALAVLFCVAPSWSDDQFLKWMDRIAQEQLTKREAAVAQIQTVPEAEAR